MFVSNSGDGPSYAFLSCAYRVLHKSWMFVTLETFVSFEIALSCVGCLVVLGPIFRAVVD